MGEGRSGVGDEGKVDRGATGVVLNDHGGDESVDDACGIDEFDDDQQNARFSTDQ